MILSGLKKFSILSANKKINRQSNMTHSEWLLIHRRAGGIVRKLPITLAAPNTNAKIAAIEAATPLIHRCTFIPLLGDRRAVSCEPTFEFAHGGRVGSHPDCQSQTLYESDSPQNRRGRESNPRIGSIEPCRWSLFYFCSTFGLLLAVPRYTL